jgi:hypothetical protein
MMMGTSDMSKDSMTEGRRPVIIPKMAEGISLSQANQEIEARVSILLTAPTKATGTAQKRIMAEMKPRTI